jgi:hypothetical protein
MVSDPPSPRARARRGDRIPWTAGVGVCVFCLRGGQKLTREHVFARWLISKVHGARLMASGAGELAAHPIGSIPMSRVITGVCAGCNAGWMSGLEVSFRRTLFGRQRVGSVQAPERAILSRWFTKTAVLLAHARGGDFIAASDRSKVRTGMPESVEVLVGRRRRPRQPIDFAIETVPDPTGAVTVRSVAIQVDDLLGHVALRGSLGSAHGTRIWPLRSHAVRWDTLPIVARAR